MLRFIKKKLTEIGLAPGTLVHIGEKRTEKPRITILDYDQTQFEEKEAKTIEECFPFKDKPSVTWINIDGIHQVDIIEKLGKHFNLHPLLLEDILDTNQRPKMEDFGDYILVVLKMFYYEEKEDEIKPEQVSIILGPDFVISFLEKEGNAFNPVRTRIKNGKGRIRNMGNDYLAYALIDAIVDSYFVTLERLGEKIEDTEEELVSDPLPQTLQTIHNLKREMIFLRKAVWPLREVISNMGRGGSSLIRESTHIYLRDLYDHTIQVMDTIESFRDMLSGMLETYLSSISNKMNQVMKVLTIIATIFIPLTFIAGIYGMNFKFMPELEWHWGYFVVLGIMIIVAVGMLFYFKRKKWL